MAEPTHEYEVRGWHPAIQKWSRLLLTPDERDARLETSRLNRLTWRDTNMEDFRVWRREVGEWEECDAP